MKTVLRRLLCLALTILLAAFLGAAMVRLAPGFGMDERQLDARLSDESRRAIQQENVGVVAYLDNLLHGELGRSISYGRPVRELLADRAGLTIHSVALGLAWAWTLAAGSVLALGVMGRRVLEQAAAGVGGMLLCLPAAVVAIVAYYVGAGPPMAIALILLPRLFRYLRNITRSIDSSAHVLAARSRGSGGLALQLRHVWRPAAPELLALGGLSVNMALGAAIPVEALCDSPGIGQLTWKAALARDLPVLVTVTILIATVTAVANLFSDLLGQCGAGNRACRGLSGGAG